jgi:FG-GAP-like repeat/FG-GAP repeat
VFYAVSQGILLAASTLATGQSYLFNRADFTTGNRPSDIAVADFNGDGQPDLAVMNQGDGTVSIFLGTPGGTFAAKVDYVTGPFPVALVAADFNGDGKIDLAVAQPDDRVSILVGQGDGTFAAPVSYPTAHVPTALAAADFNHDGHLDLAVVASNCDIHACPPGFVSILLGKGDGTFQAKTDYAIDLGPGSLAVADFNGDGKLDLAVANNVSNSISIILGNGDGTFQTHVDYPSVNGPWGIAEADLDGDKVIDLVVTHTGAPWALTTLKGNGDGSFQPETTINTLLDTSVVKIADLNGDGKQDLILSIVSQGGPIVFLGNGDGSFQPSVTYTAGNYPLAIAIADINGDNNLDLAVTDQQSNKFTVLLGNGDGTFSPRTNLPLGVSNSSLLYPLTPVIADFNADGIPDLAALEGSSGEIAVLLGKGGGTFEAPKLTTPVNSGFGTMVAADFNGDGYPDLALTTGGGFTIMLGKGDGTFGSPSPPNVTASGPNYGLVAGDFNNDGKQDIAILGSGFLQTNPIYIFLGNGDGTFQPGKQTAWNSNTVPMFIAASDFNADGKLDLVVNVNPNGIAVMLGNGDGTVQSPVLYPTDELPDLGLTVADLNGDGIPDIIAAGNLIDVFLGKGDGTFPTRVDYDGGNFPLEVITGDFNADGKIDIAATAEGPGATGNIEILLGNGDGTFQPRVEIGDAAPTGGILAVGDLNQDGTSDLVVGAGFGSLFLSGPMATLSPSLLNFGVVDTGSPTTPQKVTLTNSGNGPLKLGNVTISGPYLLGNNCGSLIGLGSSCSFDVRLNGPAPGPNPGALTVSDNAPRGRQMVALAGVGQADFSLVLASGSASATVTAGSTASYSLQVAPVGGFSQSISFACAGVPATAMCTVSPSPLSLNGTSPSPLTVKVTTTARIAALNVPARRMGGVFRFLFAGLMVPLGFLACSYRPRSRRTRLLWFALISGLLSMASISCGGGPSGGTPGGNPGPTGTAAGTYTLTVTGTSNSSSAILKHTFQLTLVVD